MMVSQKVVIPAQAGIQAMLNYLKTAVDFIDQERSLFAPGWIPAFTGMTKIGFRRLFTGPSTFNPSKKPQGRGKGKGGWREGL